MLSGWHVSHLPVLLADKLQKWQVIDEVVVSWEELKIEGFLLMPRPFHVPFVSSKAGFRLSGMGLVLPNTKEVSRMGRSWRKRMVKQQRAWKGCTILDEGSRPLGRLQDVLFDERTLRVTHLVASRGMVGDLLWGSLVIARDDILKLTPSVIKIRTGRAPFL